MPTSEDLFRASILPFTLKEEGALSLDRNDPGNWTGGRVLSGMLKGTKYGIAASSHPDLDIPRLTLAQACDIYWSDYMVTPGFVGLDPPLACVVFDCGVNCGPAAAWKLLKPVLGTGGLEQQLRSFSDANLAYHKRLKTWPRYGAVWGKRIAACEATALHIMATGTAPAVLPPPAKTDQRQAPKVATQAVAGFWTLLWRAVFGAVVPAGA